jgi:hypothetical protein
VAQHWANPGGIARMAGKIFVASGFIVATFGLTEGPRWLLQSGLGLLATGILASAYGLYISVKNRDGSSDEKAPKS